MIDVTKPVTVSELSTQQPLELIGAVTCIDRTWIAEKIGLSGGAVFLRVD